MKRVYLFEFLVFQSATLRVVNLYVDFLDKYGDRVYFSVVFFVFVFELL